jgi:hypothetical protein
VIALGFCVEVGLARKAHNTHPSSTQRQYQVLRGSPELKGRSGKFEVLRTWT